MGSIKLFNVCAAIFSFREGEVQKCLKYVMIPFSWEAGKGQGFICWSASAGASNGHKECGATAASAGRNQQRTLWEALHLWRLSHCCRHSVGQPFRLAPAGNARGTKGLCFFYVCSWLPLNGSCRPQNTKAMEDMAEAIDFQDPPVPHALDCFSTGTAHLFGKFS